MTASKDLARTKHRLLQLATELSNVSHSCRSQWRQDLEVVIE